MRTFFDIVKAAKGGQAATHKYIARKPDGKGGWVYKYAGGKGWEGERDGEHEEVKGHDVASDPIVTKEDIAKISEKYKSVGIDKLPPPGATNLIDHGDRNDIHDGPIVTWKDKRDKTQYAYTEVFNKRNAAIKWARVRKLAPKVAATKTKLRKILSDEKETRAKRDTAAAMLIIAYTGMRPGHGGESRVDVYGTRGVMTMEKKSVVADKATGDIIFKFTGKAKVANTYSLNDKQLANYISEAVNVEGNALWETKLSGHHLSTALSTAGLSGYKTKDLRTYVACKEASAFLSEHKSPPPLTTKEVKNIVKGCSEHVSKLLNNSPAMARKSYIAPAIFEAWHKNITVLSKADMSKLDFQKQILLDAFNMAAPYLGPAKPGEDDDSDELELFPLPDWAIEGDKTKTKKSFSFNALIKATKGGQKATHKYIARKPDGKGGWVYKYAGGKGWEGKRDGEHTQKHHAEVTENGANFKTGEAVTVPVTHRKQKTQTFGSKFGQDIEPAGRYVVHGHHGEAGTVKHDWGSEHDVTTTHDTVTFKNALVIHHVGTGGSDPDTWKRRLSDRHGGKKGKALSRAIAKKGHDGIVTVSSYEDQGETKYSTSEIVDLTHLHKTKKSFTRLVSSLTKAHSEAVAKTTNTERKGKLK